MKMESIARPDKEMVLGEKKRTYEHACCRCGFCCLSEVCPAGRLYYRLPKHSECPALNFGGDGVAACALVPIGLVPVGDGCCIKARAFKNGVEYDFAALPAHLKRRAAHDARIRARRAESEKEVHGIGRKTASTPQRR